MLRHNPHSATVQATVLQPENATPLAVNPIGLNMDAIDSLNL
jgi:hypothetical protein